jgi:pyoverdine/dityrosine biosynthesis protein Dit1
MKVTDQIIDEVILLIDCFRRKDGTNKVWTEKGIDPIKSKIRKFYDAKTPIKFMLPSFPFKSNNRRDKVMGVLPDEGELLALNYFDYLMQTIENVYPYGAEFYIFIDGFLYSHIVGVSDNVAENYVSKLQTMLPKHVKMISVKSVFLEAKGHEKIREEFIKKYCWTIEETKEQLKTDEDAQIRLKRSVPFIIEELGLQLESMPREERNKKVEIATLDFIRCDVGLGKMIRENFEDYIRLSRHAQSGDSEKIGISFFAGGDKSDCPWHRMLLKKKNGSFDFINKISGENNKNYRLILTDNGESGYFVEL